MNTNASLLSLGDPILTRIVTFISEDRKSLCTLFHVNRALSAVIKSVLYAKISVSTRADVYALRDFLNCEAENRLQCVLNTSCLPGYAPYVETFEVTASILSVPAQKDLLHSLEVILSNYSNLRSFIWRPSLCEAELSLGVAHILPRLPGLKHLSFKVPFILPEIPKTPALRMPATNLDVIAEEEEDEELDAASHVANMPRSETANDFGSDTEDVAPYEYKPLEHDPGTITESTTQPLYSIPPPELKHIQSLVLASPSSEVLIHLPDALRGLEHPLRCLCFEENCGPVTPQSLAWLVPFLQEVEYFGLGVSYSVKYDDLIPFLEGLPKLRTLDIFHYHQLYKKTSPVAHLPSLKSLRVSHAHTNSRQELVSMCVWIRRVISSSSLEELEIACDNRTDCLPRTPGHGISRDGLIDHLLARHRASLRTLRMPNSYVGIGSMKRLLGKNGKGCGALEEVDICVRRQVADSLADLIKASHKLRSLHLTIVNLKKRKQASVSVDQDILRGGSTPLRSVIVNGRGFMGEWTVDIENEAQPKLRPAFKISEIRKIMT